MIFQNKFTKDQKPETDNGILECQLDPAIWEANVAAWRARQNAGDLLPALPEQPPALPRLVYRAGPPPSLKAPDGKGRLVSLHSPKDPWKEARCLAERVFPGDSQNIVILGLGLGYFVLTLLQRLRPEHRLIVVEQDLEVCCAALGALDLTPLLQHPRTALLVDPDYRKVAAHLEGHFKLGNGQGLTFFGHPPSLRLHDGYYQEVIRRLRPAPPRQRGPLGVKQEQFRALIINPEYFLIPEVTRAFRSLGHKVRSVFFDKRREPGEEVMRRILAEARDYAPDLVFTVNHLGLDRQGLLLDFFHRLRVPLVSWYVDSPAIILNLYAGRQSELAYIFVWDPTYIPEVKALGFNQVFPLPLATDPGIFRPRAAAELAPWQSPVTFVGNSLTEAVRQKLKCLPSSPEFRRLFHKLAQAYRDKPFRRLQDLLREENLTGHPLIQGLSSVQLTDLEAGIIWEATRSHRLACVKRLADFQPVLYGDPGWRRLVKTPFTVRPEVNYFDELPLIYGASAVNFNVTSLQMKTAVNQRVFDAPAAGGFLLTDYKEQLGELLEIGREIICYRHPDEIPELTRFYLKSDRAREEIVSRGRRRIMAEHTYVQRLQAMVDIIRRTL
jgi:spore maturation protein CgeB